MSGSQQVKRYELLTHHRDPSLPQHSGDCTLDIGGHESCSLQYGFTAFFYTQASLCCVSFVVSNGRRVPEFTQMAWLGEEFGESQEMEKKTESQLQSGFCCCRSSGRHPGLSAVSPREVQRAHDEDEAIVSILPVRHSAPQFAFDGGGERKPQGSVGKCSEGLWLGNLFGCKLKISPCGDNNQVPLVTISM